MRRKQVLTFSVPLCICIVIAATWSARAGDLTPPEGPVGPTMLNLDEIANLITGTSQCPACTWDYKFYDGVQPSADLVVAGSGVVHSVLVARDEEGIGDLVVQLTDGPDVSTTIAAVRAGGGANDQAVVPLDVRFENGLYIRSVYGTDGRVTVLYLAD